MVGSTLSSSERLTPVPLADCCKPNQLRQSDIAGIYRGLQEWSQLVRVDDPATGKGLYLVDLNTDQPPFYAALLGDSPGAQCRYLDTEPLVAHLEQLKQVFSSIEEKSFAIDKSLKGFIGSMESKVFKDMENIQKRLKKAEEKNHDTAMTQIDSLKAKLFPNGSLQERHDNFLNFYLNNPDFIKDIQASFDPLDFRFLLLSESVS